MYKNTDTQTLLKKLKRLKEEELYGIDNTYDIMDIEDELKRRKLYYEV